MDRLRTWFVRLAALGFMAGALLSRDACLGGARPPPPKPDPDPTAAAAEPTAAPTAEPAAAPTAEPAAEPAPTATFAAPP